MASEEISESIEWRNIIFDQVKKDYRSEEAATYRAKYKTKRWRDLRAWHLRQEPLCAFCLLYDSVAEEATVVDHIKPHKGEDKLFWDSKNLQSLCKKCHDGRKQRMENREDQPVIGVDGWPIE